MANVVCFHSKVIGNHEECAQSPDGICTGLASQRGKHDSSSPITNTLNHAISSGMVEFNNKGDHHNRLAIWKIPPIAKTKPSCQMSDYNY